MSYQLYYESTSSTMTWDSKQHNLAPTLVESVTLFLKGLCREQEGT